MKKDSILLYEEAKQLYLQGISLSQIEKDLKIERHKLSKAFKEDGINIVINNQKHIYNEDFFKSIDTEEKAYWLGFLFADGWIELSTKRYVLGLSLSIEDKNHIEKFAKIISPTVKIKEFNSKLKNNEYPSVRIQINNKNIVESLIQLGCLPKKSTILKFPNIPKDLYRHFIRGYFDGDGCVYITKTPNNVEQINMNILGTKEMLESIQNIFEEYIPEYTRTKIKKKKDNQAYDFAKGGNHCIKIIYDYLYKDSTIYLERKYNKFANFFNGKLPS